MTGEFANTTIGRDLSQGGGPYSTDLLLDYLFGLIEMRKGVEGNTVWTTKYTLEIEAVKEVLKMQSK